jgi:undecaprenyl-diphosphatase
MHQHTGIGTFNQPVLSWIIKHRQPQITNVMKIITMVASPLVFAGIVCVVAVIWALINREIWRPLLLAGTVGFAAATSAILKVATSNVRPPRIDMIIPFETDYSFPSGHTIGIIVFFLVIGYLICSRNSSGGRVFSWLTITTVCVGIMAASRLYLGYHWLTDVIASIGLGLIILAIAVFVDRLVVRRFEN